MKRVYFVWREGVYMQGAFAGYVVDGCLILLSIRKTWSI